MNREKVELRHLRALAAIGDEGTITDAARVLGISQPALSRALDQLETRLGTRLVERTTRSLALTEAGQRLWQHAHRILRQMDDALRDVAGGPRPLRIGFAWASFRQHTVPLLRAWRQAHPDTPVQMHRRDDPESALYRGEVDAALVRTTPTAGGSLNSAELYRERRLAAVPENHPLADGDTVTPADLADQPVVLCATAATTRAGLWPDDSRPHTFEVANVDEWLTVIATGDAVGVTAEGTGHSHPHPGIRYLPLTDVPPVTVRLIWPRPPTHPATRSFCDHARRMTGPPG
ncbi:LysR family transcriptional regulator [Streptomyces chattanoogensis]